MRLTCLLLVLALPASAQTQQPIVPPLIERAEVRLVNVDVTVSDSQGKPVIGLTQDDFEVLEDGEARPISGFYVIENAAVRLLGGDNEVLSEREKHQFQRKIVLVIDNNTLQRPNRDAALEFVARFVENKHEGEEWSVVAVGHTVETLQSFTTNEESIRAALLTARRHPVNVQESAIDRDLLSDPGRARLRQDPASGYDFDSTARFQSREQTARNLQAMKNSARAIIETCRAYSASTGRKALILLTGGMELNTSFAAYDSSQDRQLNEMKRDMERVVDTMVRQANAANFKMYIVKGGGQTPRAPQHEVSNRSAGLGGTAKNPFFGPGYSRAADISDVDSAPLSLALRTGGQYFAGRKVTEALQEVDDVLSNSYSLAFQPKAPEDGQYHRIQVKVKRPQTTVLHREGYLAISPQQRLEESLRAPITFAKEKGELPVTLEVGTPERTADGKPLVSFVATMPISAVNTIPQAEGRLGRVHVYLTIYDEQGTNVGFHHQIQDFRMPANQVPNANQRFRYANKVALKKGAFTLVLTLRDEISGEIGSALAAVKL